jgi:protein-disulfide isomerase
MRKFWFALAAVVTFSTMLGIAAPARAADIPVQTPDDRTIGKADAPITIFEFFSLTCPHCAEFENESYPKLKAEWIDTGKVKMVYRDYPLDQNALKAAMVARCAPPDRYAAFVQVLFAQQTVWGVQRDPTDALKKIAALGGIPGDQFDKCIADDDLSKKIVAGEYDAQKKYGVDSTPTFFINGKMVVGALEYDEFVKELQNAHAASLQPSVQTAENTQQ